MVVFYADPPHWREWCNTMLPCDLFLFGFMPDSRLRSISRVSFGHHVYCKKLIFNSELKLIFNSLKARKPSLSWNLPESGEERWIHVFSKGISAKWTHLTRSEFKLSALIPLSRPITVRLFACWKISVNILRNIRFLTV